MELLMDMVHDNPGEPRFQTGFRDPKKLKAYGYNTQVFKHYNTIIRFDALHRDFFPTPESKQWLKQMTQIAEEEIYTAKKENLMVMCHIDLFVLPKVLTDIYHDEICDENGSISLEKERTKEIHRILFDELFSRYPIDGIIVRVGETYLHDTPFHVGNGAVRYGNKQEEQRSFINLINFLRQEICVKHGKYLIFRTWDCFPDRFHANLEYYLNVTNAIPVHPKLIFSVKHTALDFWRNVQFNPCLAEGKHRQVIEVQCQREYEGKGAYPMYVMDGIINGFKENTIKKGLCDIIHNPLICGLYSWSRGGGWDGPYIKDEFWCDLNTYVICKFMQYSKKTELQIFNDYAQEVMGLSTEDAVRFHSLCLTAADAVLHGRYIAAYDRSLNEQIMPCANWIRDDRIGGLRQLSEVFEYLEQHNLVEEAINEKRYAVELWYRVKDISSEITYKNEDLKEKIDTSIEYAVRLFTILQIAFEICAKCRRQVNVRDLIDSYDCAWKKYRELSHCRYAASLYRESYKFAEHELGLDETITYCRKHLI